MKTLRTTLAAALLASLAFAGLSEEDVARIARVNASDLLGVPLPA